MSSMGFDSRLFNREVAFCKVYSLESKEKLEKLFSKNRISYFIDWQERTFWQRIFGSGSKKEKNVFTIRINEADVERAKELIQGIDSVKLRKSEQHN